MDTTFLQERETKLKAQIVAYENAIDAIITKGQKSYTLDTGQTRTSVTRQDVSQLQSTLTYLYSLLSTIHARLYGASGQMRPRW